MTGTAQSKLHTTTPIWWQPPLRYDGACSNDVNDVSKSKNTWWWHLGGMNIVISIGFGIASTQCFSGGGINNLPSSALTQAAKSP